MSVDELLVTLRTSEVPDAIGADGSRKSPLRSATDPGCAVIVIRTFPEMVQLR